MAVTIMTDSWKEECIATVMKDWMLHFPHRYRAYMEGIRQLHSRMKGWDVWSKAKTMVYRGAMPTEVLRMIQLNWREFMNGTERQKAKDMRFFLRVVSDSLLRPKAAGFYVPHVVGSRRTPLWRKSG